MSINGSCHCKATQFEVSEAPDSLTQCTCSFCSKRGALNAYYKPEQFKLKTSRDRVSTYPPTLRLITTVQFAVVECIQKRPTFPLESQILEI